MKLIKILILFSLLSAGCASQYNTIKKPVFIPYLGDYDKSAHQKYEYLEDNFGKRGIAWKLASRKVFEKNKKVYDRMIIRLLPSGPDMVVYFDITEVTNGLVSDMAENPKIKR